MYFGDVNGDGIDDVYLKARNKMLLVGIEVNTPVIYQDSPSLLLKGLGGDDGYEEIVEWGADVNLSSLSKDRFSIHLADMDGDGRLDYLLQSKHVSRYNAIIYAGEGFTVDGSYSFLTVDGDYATEDYADWTLRDVNGDNKTDLILNEGTSDQKVAISNGQNGLYAAQYGSPSSSGTTVVCWSSQCQWLYRKFFLQHSNCCSCRGGECIREYISKLFR